MKFVFAFLLACILTVAGAQADSSFTETPLILNTPSGDLFGTLTLPNTPQQVPVVLMHSGSGPTDRNGNNAAMQNNSLQMLAHALASHGMATLRFDKRGVGQSRKAARQEADMRFDDLVADAKAWLALLRKDKRFSKLVVLGHSEGSLVGMLAAKENAAAFISLAGPGRPAAVVLKEQFGAQPPAVKDAAFPILDSLAAGQLVRIVPPVLASMFRPSVQPYMVSWFRYDPAAVLAQLNMPVLVVQGTTDIQVSMEDASLLHKANRNGKLAAIPNMNHVLKQYAGNNRMENISTYNKPTLPLHPSLVPELLLFLKAIE